MTNLQIYLNWKFGICHLKTPTEPKLTEELINEII